MNAKKLQQRARLLVASGLLLAAMPTLLNDYIKFADFLRGALMGLGIGLEIGGLILLARMRKAGSGC
jgi:hypothetical protein